MDTEIKQMSAKELILIPKQKYNLLNHKHSPEMVSTGTQTEEQPDMKKPVDNGDSNDVRIQAVRSTSWNVIPGLRQNKKKKRPRKTIKWIPY